MLSSIFLDEAWFLDRLELAYDTDHRCQHIDTALDWYYMDDWADKFTTQQFGREFFEEEVGRRILLANPHGDGSDILQWLDEVVPHMPH